MTRAEANRPGDVFAEGGAFFVVVSDGAEDIDGPMTEAEAIEHAATFGDD